MGISTHIKAFIPDTNPDYQRHRKVALACIEAGVSLPSETKQYFNHNALPTHDMLDGKLEIELIKDIHYEDWADESSQGFEVDLTNLPKGVTKLRFYNSW